MIVTAPKFACAGALRWRVLPFLLALCGPSVGCQAPDTAYIRTAVDLQNLAAGVELHRVVHGSEPDDLDSLVVWLNGTGIARTPISVDLFVDGWGSSFLYEPSSAADRPYYLASCGQDSRCSPQPLLEAESHYQDDLVIQGGRWLDSTVPRRNSDIVDLAIQIDSCTAEEQTILCLFEIDVLGPNPDRFELTTTGFAASTTFAEVETRSRSSEWLDGSALQVQKSIRFDCEVDHRKCPVIVCGIAMPTSGTATEINIQDNVVCARQDSSEGVGELGTVGKYSKLDKE
ncbi:MAG: hypothetical protein GY708_11085 [Actinomycetia bacterium]|nr:hypothetical protein [Actinomycetes bacterium]